MHKTAREKGKKNPRKSILHSWTLKEEVNITHDPDTKRDKAWLLLSLLQSLNTDTGDSPAYPGVGSSHGCQIVKYILYKIIITCAILTT